MGKPLKELWEVVADRGVGRPKSITPSEFWERAKDYFQWCSKNPWNRVDPVKAGDRFGEHVNTPIDRPFTIQGLCLYIGIDDNTFSRYEKQEGYEEYWAITRAIKNIIYTQKFEGAAVGVFNQNIIARDLGLTEKQEITSTKIKVTKTDAG